MGASVVAYWPGITEEQLDAQPGFRNDDRAWGNWMVELEDKLVAGAIRQLGADAIMTMKMDDWDDDDVAWVTPRELRDATIRLRDAVRAKTPGVATVLASYELHANRHDPVAEEFIRDLEDIEAMANWAETVGATRMTLEVSW